VTHEIKLPTHLELRPTARAIVTAAAFCKTLPPDLTRVRRIPSLIRTYFCQPALLPGYFSRAAASLSLFGVATFTRHTFFQVRFTALARSCSPRNCPWPRKKIAPHAVGKKTVAAPAPAHVAHDTTKKHPYSRSFMGHLVETEAGLLGLNPNGT
jgi:hypothetical protein